MKTKSSLAKAIIKNQNITSTENGMQAYSSSLDACLDMFFQAGGARAWSDETIITLWEKAYSENKAVAYKLLFWARDVRGGAGERRFFRVILKHIAESSYSEELLNVLKLIPHFGRWDDLECLILCNNKKIREYVLNLYKIGYDECDRLRKIRNDC